MRLGRTAEPPPPTPEQAELEEALARGESQLRAAAERLADIDMVVERLRSELYGDKERRENGLTVKIRAGAYVDYTHTHAKLQDAQAKLAQAKGVFRKAGGAL